jgi:metal-responsive CopG/Arc/MetJ family transcriptional regulator
MLYIMRRTQLYLEEDLWKALHARARRERTSVSELVRQATRDRYMRHSEDRQADMIAAVGIWKDRTDLPDAEKYVRDLRRGTRLKRLGIE